MEQTKEKMPTSLYDKYIKESEGIYKLIKFYDILCKGVLICWEV